MKPGESSTDVSADESRSQTTRRTLLGSLGIAAATVLTGCTVSGEVDRETASVEYTLPGNEVDRVSVSGGDGETTVRRWEGTDVRVEATKFARGKTELSDVTVTREMTGGRLDVGAEVPVQVGIGAFGGGLDSLDVRVPEGTRVTRIDIDDGSGRVTEVTGDIDLDVDDGSAEVGPVDGRLDVTVDDGTVTVGEVDRVTGELDDGDLEMTEPATLGDLTADDGDLDLAIEDIDGDITVQCDDGDVTARVTPTIDATVVANADDDAVRFEGGVFDSVTTTGGTTRGRIGDGNDQLTIDVDDGEIRVKPFRQ
jgi:hypothetical protein